MFNSRHPKPSLTSFYRMATSPVFVSSLKYEVKQMMHQLPPLPYDDSTGTLQDFRHHILEKVLVWGQLWNFVVVRVKFNRFLHSNEQPKRILSY